MDILVGILIAILGLVLIVVIKLSTTLFHELGHAIPALLFTKKNVEVYVGSYGDITNSTTLTFGRLKIYLKWNIFDWKIGLCRHEEPARSIKAEILIILGGPIASLLISIPILLNIKYIDSDSPLFLAGVVFIAAATYDFIVNIIPISKPLKMHNGNLAYCDGYQLLSIYQRSKLPAAFFELEHSFLAKDYKTVIELGNEFLVLNPNHRYIYDFIINSCIAQENDQLALDYYSKFMENNKLDEEDYFKIGKLNNSIGKYNVALKYFKAYWFTNYQNIELLNEMAHAQNKLGEHELANERLNSSN